MAITSDTFIERYPKFSGLSEDVITLVIEEAYCFIPESIWTTETKRDLGALYLTAHILTVERRDQLEEGLVLKDLNERENNVYEDLLDKSSDTNYYKLSVYGKKFLQLRDSIVGTTFFVL